MTTTEDIREPQWLTTAGDQGYIQRPIPGVDYSAIRVPIVEDEAEQQALIDRALRASMMLQDALGTVVVREPVHEAPHNPSTASQRPAAPQQRPQQARGQSGPARGQGRAQGDGTGLYCAEHGVALRKTAAKYDDTGDRFYHPLDQQDWFQLEDGRTVKNCNRWRSEAVTADELQDAPF